MSDSWYQYGSDYVLVRSGMPNENVKIGIGSEYADAIRSLEMTSVQSTGPDSGVSGALNYAHGNGRIDELDDLEDDDGPDGSDGPVGEIDWYVGGQVDYVQCCYGTDGDQPGDCRARYGVDLAGLWWVGDGDDDVGDVDVTGPYASKSDARDAAEEIAAENSDGEVGEDMDAHRARLDEEALAHATDDGEWIVGWYDPDRRTRTAGRRYEDRADAEREIGAWYDAVLRHTPNAMTHLMVHPVLCKIDEDGRLTRVRGDDV